MPTAREMIALLELEKHPEGGWFRETWRAKAEQGERSAGTAIYYLLDFESFSHWHRVDADETWHWYAGAPLVLSLSPDGHDAEANTLSSDIQLGHRPQITVPAGWWQSATSLGEWTLLGCTVVPGFEFDGFDLAAPNWRPTPPGA